MGLRAAAVTALTRSGLASLCRPLTRGHAVVFMLHRFADPARGVNGFDPEVLRRLLAFLRKRRHDFVDLSRLMERLDGNGPPLRRAVTFTIDDGYREQASVAGPIFAEFDCPVTTFVTTGFLDRALWFWWDQIEYIFARTTRPTVDVTAGGERLRYVIGDSGARTRGQEDFLARCKTLTETDKQAAIRSLALGADVELPVQAPEAYQPMTWDELRGA